MITSKDNKKIKELFKLNQTKYRKKVNQFLVFNDKIIKEGIATNSIITIITCDENFPFENLFIVSEEIIKYLSNGVAKKNIGLCLYNHSQYPRFNKVLVLDNIQDPGNMGTILRNAKAFGYDDVVISKDCVDVYNQKVLNSAMGVNFHLNIYVADIYEYLLNDTRKIITTFLDESSNISESRIHNLVLGNEGSGINLKIKELEHENFTIDIEFESLNVSVASGIIMNDLRR